MRSILLAPLLLVACATTGDSRAAADREVATLLAGRTAGPASECLDKDRVDNLRAVGDRTIVAGGGRRLWVSALPESCPSLRADSTLIVELRGSQYCRNDMVTAVSPGQIPGAACRLGRFVPYDLPRD